MLDEPAAAVRAWLFTVARNIVIDEWRSRRSQRELAVAEVPERADPTTAPTSCCSRGWSPTRSPSCRRTTARCCSSATTGAGPVAEAARHLGVPEGTVKSRTHYALRALRLALEEMGVSA